MKANGSAGHIMVTTLYSNHQGSKSRQNPCRVQPTENIGNLLASRLCPTVSTVWSAPSVSESELQATEKDCLMCCPSNKVIKSDTKLFLALGGLDEDKSCDTLQETATTNVKTVHQTSLFHIESNLDRPGLSSPTHGQCSQQQSG